MPELPEVEVIKQSLDKKIKFQKINKVLVRNRNLRFKVPKNFEFFLKNKKINEISRKSKYLIFHLNNNTFLINCNYLATKYNYHVPGLEIDLYYFFYFHIYF